MYRMLLETEACLLLVLPQQGQNKNCLYLYKPTIDGQLFSQLILKYTKSCRSYHWITAVAKSS